VRRNTKEGVINKKEKVRLPTTKAMPTLFSFNELNKVFFKVPFVSLASKFISKYYTKLPLVVTEQRRISKTEYLPLSHLIYKGKRLPLQAWNGPEGSRKLRFPD